MKTCKKCSQTLPINSFYDHKQMADGKLNICKECVKERVRTHRQQNLESIQRYDRMRGRTEKRKEKCRKYNRENKELLNAIKSRWIKNNPEKAFAYKLVRRAILNGSLKKECCEICGNNKVEAHHSDYSEPLFVAWLCRKHHAELHRKYADENGGF